MGKTTTAALDIANKKRKVKFHLGCVATAKMWRIRAARTGDKHLKECCTNCADLWEQTAKKAPK